MTTYKDFISQFEVLDKRVGKKGYHYHHIVPKSEQTAFDDRGILVTPAQHLWAHILYDREHNTDTVRLMLHMFGVDKEDIKSYEDCLVFNEVDCSKQNKQSNQMKGSNNPMFDTHRSGETNPFYNKTHSEEVRQILSNKISKRNTSCHWYHNENTEMFTPECPEGYVPGRLYHKRRKSLIQEKIK